MANRFEDIARRKQALIDQAAHQRVELTRSYAELKSPFEVSSMVLGIGRVLKTHPVVAAALSTFFVSGFAGKALRSSGKLLQLWRIAQPIWILARKLGKR